MEFISQEKAKEIMDTQNDYIILDVRREDEYAVEHIPNAINIPLEDIEDIAEFELPDKDKLLLIYCRSGRSSKMAAGILDSIGYTNIMEFGGIIDWKYEKVTL